MQVSNKSCLFINVYEPPVMYYSNNILAKTLPESGPHLSLLMSAVNCLMTFPAIILIDVS